MSSPVYDVIVGESLPDLSVWAKVDNALVTGLDAGHTFSVLVRDPTDTVTLFTKTAGIVGQTGTGTQTNGTPNVLIQWAVAGELDQLTEDRSHKAMLTITRTADSKVRYYEFVIRATAQTG